jgi:hypothetical protein
VKLRVSRPDRQVQALRALLTEFKSQFEAAEETGVIPRHENTLTEFEREHTAWKKTQTLLAEDFNLFTAMRLTRKELCHSDMLAWLLDHRLEAFGTHAQGNAGFTLLLQKLGLPSVYAKTNYRVYREVAGKESILDIVIECEKRFVIGIENKVDAREGDDQTLREWADMTRRATTNHTPASRMHAFFLTPEALQARSQQFKPISWQLISTVFSDFAEIAKPPMVKLFASHYADTLRRHLVPQTRTEED